MRTIGQTHCRMCGKTLSLVKRLLSPEFCNHSHKSAYLREQEELGLARLLERNPRTLSEDDAAIPELVPPDSAAT